jgi:hypothetical protein
MVKVKLYVRTHEGIWGNVGMWDLLQQKIKWRNKQHGGEHVQRGYEKKPFIESQEEDEEMWAVQETYEKQKLLEEYSLCSCYELKMVMIMMTMIMIYSICINNLQRTTILNSSRELSATQNPFYFRSEDISIWCRKVKLFYVSLLSDHRVHFYGRSDVTCTDVLSTPEGIHDLQEIRPWESNP